MLRKWFPWGDDKNKLLKCCDNFLLTHRRQIKEDKSFFVSRFQLGFFLCDPKIFRPPYVSTSLSGFPVLLSVSFLTNSVSQPMFRRYQCGQFHPRIIIQLGRFQAHGIRCKSCIAWLDLKTYFKTKFDRILQLPKKLSKKYCKSITLVCKVLCDLRAFKQHKCK